MDPGVASSRTPGTRFEAVRRNIYRARVRLGFEHARSRAGANEDIRDQDGDIAHDPSNYEPIPKVSQETLSTRSFASLIDSTRNSERGENTEDTCPNPDAP